MSQNLLGTPKDLKEAICRGIGEVTGDPRIVTREDAIVKQFHDIIQDRLAQSFTTAMCGTNSEGRLVLMDLWYSIFPGAKAKKPL